MDELHPLEKKVLSALKDTEAAPPQEISKVSGLDINSVMRSLNWLSSKRLVKIDETFDEIISLGEEGKVYLDLGLPERRAVEFLKSGEKSLDELRSVLGPEIISVTIGWLRKKGLADIRSGVVRLKGDVFKPTGDEKLISILKNGSIEVSEIPEDLKKWIKPLSTRKDVINVEKRVKRLVSLTPSGRTVLEKKRYSETGSGQLTHEMLKDGSWKKKGFRKYSISRDATRALPAKLHPLTIMIDEIKDIFTAMGFKEIEGPIVESSFWNFDALFVPQDHPAREMQDTFYLKAPDRALLPDKKVVRAISKVHMDGGETGSRGWGYRWDEEVASKTLLRTHTTSTTIRQLSKREPLPVKVFSIGRVFRKERISFKHLPEFHQIEGIVVGNVNFKNLLGILREFYKRMGFEKIRFRPAYFPYTEPSLEVEVYFEKKGSWIELGGAGIFRPEVSEPLGINKPVLAWGLGLERLAMLRLDLADIRMFYKSDIDWLRSIPL